jgi:hypothetical protein
MLSHLRIAYLLLLMVAGQSIGADIEAYITEKITFDSDAENPPAGTTWEWDFGDGTTSREKEPVHAYKEPGNFMVLVKVKIPNIKALPFDPTEVEVKDVNPKVEYTPEKFYVGQEVTFKTQYKADSKLKFEWDFGDGSKPSHESAPKHRFLKSVKHTIKLTVFVPDGDALPAPEFSLMVDRIVVKIEGPDVSEFDTLTPVKIENLTKGPWKIMTWQWEIMGPDGKPVELKDADARGADELTHIFETEGEHTITLKAKIPGAPDDLLPESDPVVVTITSPFETPVIKAITVAPSKIGENGDYTAQIFVDATGDYKKVEVSIEGLKNPPAQEKEKASQNGRHIFEFSVPIPPESVSRKLVSRDIVISAAIHPESPNSRPIVIPHTISLTIVPQQPGWILYLYIAGGILVMAIIAWLAIRTARS